MFVCNMCFILSVTESVLSKDSAKTSRSFVALVLFVLIILHPAAVTPLTEFFPHHRVMVVIISMNANRATFTKFAILTNFLCRWQFIIGNHYPRRTHLFHGSLAWQAVVIMLPYCPYDPCACQCLTKLTECFAVPVEQGYTRWVACR